MISVSHAIWMILRSARVGRSESASCPPPLASASHTAPSSLFLTHLADSLLGSQVRLNASVPRIGQPPPSRAMTGFPRAGSRYTDLGNTALCCEAFSSVPRGTRDHCAWDLCGRRAQHLKPNHHANAIVVAVPSPGTRVARAALSQVRERGCRRVCELRFPSPRSGRSQAADHSSAPLM
jgi:hypothetical protein